MARETQDKLTGVLSYQLLCIRDRSGKESSCLGIIGPVLPLEIKPTATPGSHRSRFKLLTASWAACVCFAPQSALFFLIPISAVISSIRLLFIVCSPFIQQYGGMPFVIFRNTFPAFLAESHFSSLSNGCAPAHPSLTVLCSLSPSVWGPFHLSLTLSGASCVSA